MSSGYDPADSTERPASSGYDPADLTERLRSHARDEGLTLFGVAEPTPSDHLDFYRRWIDAGAHGEMRYLARPDAIERRADLTKTWPTVRSVVVVGDEYYREDATEKVDDPSRGIIARYARGRDYHRVLKGKLLRLLRWLDGEVTGGVEGRAYVDTGPILERELARRAGLGWFGRNTMLIHPRRGSYFFLGLLLLDVELQSRAETVQDRCGTCRACLDACPTGALLGRDEGGAPRIDARRCISYLTIELKGPIPAELRPLIGNRVFGCDICQEVCPFNRRFAEEADEPGYAARGPGELPSGVQAVAEGERSPEGVSAEARTSPGAEGTRVRPEHVSAETPRGVPGEKVPGEHPAAETRRDVSAETPGVGKPGHPGTDAPSLVALMRMTHDDWDAFSRGSAIRRAGYAGFKRNVAVAMGNWLAEVDEPPAEALAVLRQALEDGEPLVREHAAWALGRLRHARM